jgi:hypothetical protein
MTFALHKFSPAKPNKSSRRKLSPRYHHGRPHPSIAKCIHRSSRSHLCIIHGRPPGMIIAAGQRNRPSYAERRPDVVADKYPDDCVAWYQSITRFARTGLCYIVPMQQKCRTGQSPCSYKLLAADCACCRLRANQLAEAHTESDRPPLA